MTSLSKAEPVRNIDALLDTFHAGIIIMNRLIAKGKRTRDQIDDAVKERRWSVLARVFQGNQPETCFSLVE